MSKLKVLVRGIILYGLSWRLWELRLRHFVGFGLLAWLLECLGSDGFREIRNFKESARKRFRTWFAWWKEKPRYLMIVDFSWIVFGCDTTLSPQCYNVLKLHARIYELTKYTWLMHEKSSHPISKEVIAFLTWIFEWNFFSLEDSTKSCKSTRKKIMLPPPFEFPVRPLSSISPTSPVSISSKDSKSQKTLQL